MKLTTGCWRKNGWCAAKKPNYDLMLASWGENRGIAWAGLEMESRISSTIKFEIEEAKGAIWKI